MEHCFFNRLKGNKGSACPRQDHLPTNLDPYSLTSDPKHSHTWVMSDRVDPSALEHWGCGRPSSPKREQGQFTSHGGQWPWLCITATRTVPGASRSSSSKSKEAQDVGDGGQTCSCTSLVAIKRVPRTGWPCRAMARSETRLPNSGGWKGSWHWPTGTEARH